MSEKSEDTNGAIKTVNRRTAYMQVPLWPSKGTKEQTDLQKTPQKSEDCAIRISIKTGDPPELIRLQWYLLNTSGAGTTYPSGAPEFSWGSCYSIFSFMCTPLVSSNSSIKNRPFIYHICIYNIFHKRISCIDSLIMCKITEVCCLLK
jgi:hypothetical protein